MCSALIQQKHIRKEREAITPEFISDAYDPNIHLKCESAISVTFVHEGAGYRNQLGYFVYNNATKVESSRALILEDASMTYGGGCLNAGDSVTIGPFPAGSSIGFYVVANGYAGGTTTFYSENSLPARAADGKRHVAIAYDEIRKILTVGFEDLWNLGDQDYNDLMFFTKTTSDCLDDAALPHTDENGMLVEYAPDPQRVINDRRKVNGVYVATIDQVDPNEDSIGVQHAYLDVPDMWQLVNETAFSRAFMSCYNMGSAGVVFANGHSVSPGSLKSLGDDDLKQNEQGGYGPKKGLKRVLLQAEVVNVGPSVLNGGIDDVSNGAAEEWSMFEEGYVLDDTTSKVGLRSLKMTQAPGQTHGAWQQLPSYQKKGCKPLPGEDHRSEQSVEKFRLCRPHKGAYKAWDVNANKVEDLLASDVGYVLPNTQSPAHGLLDCNCDSVKTRDPFAVCAWSKANVNRRGNTGTFEYDIYVDMFYTESSGLSPLYAFTNAFTSTTHGWEKKCVQMYPRGDVAYTNVYLLVRGDIEGTFWFDDVAVEPVDGNLLVNSCLNPDDDTPVLAEKWAAFESGYTLVGPGAGGNTDACGWMCMENTALTDTRGAVQVILVPEGLASKKSNTLYLNVVHSAAGVSGEADGDFSVYVDVYEKEKDNNPTTAKTVPLTPGTHPMQEAFGTVVVSHDIHKIVVVPLFRKHTGRACFQLPEVRLLQDCETALGTNGGASVGDPHIFPGNVEANNDDAFDFQAIGEFELYVSDQLNIQVRQSIAGEAAINTAVAVVYNGTVVSIKAETEGKQPQVRLGGTLMTMPDGPFAQLFVPSSRGIGKGVLTRTGNLTQQHSDALKFSFNFPAIQRLVEVVVLESSYRVQYLQIVVKKNIELGAEMGVIKGPYMPNSNKANTHSKLYSEYADSWRVTDQTSALPYESGKKTADYTNKEFFKTPFDEGKFSAAQRKAADDACASLGNDKVKGMCRFDVLATADPAFAMGFPEVEREVGLSTPIIPEDELPGPEPNTTPPPWYTDWVVWVSVGGVIFGLVAVALIVRYFAKPPTDKYADTDAQGDGAPPTALQKAWASVANLASPSKRRRAPKQGHVQVLTEDEELNEEIALKNKDNNEM